MALRYIIGLAFLAVWCSAVDHEVFRTCEENFCNRLRNKEPKNDTFVDASSVNIEDNKVSANLISGNRTLLLTIYAIEDDTFRVTIEDVDRPRFPIPDALVGEPKLAQIDTVSVTGNITITFGNGNRAVALTSPHPIIQFYKNDVLVVVLNEKGRFTYEDEGENQAVTFDVAFPAALRAYGIPEHADQLPLRTTETGGLDPYRLYNLDVAYYELDSPMALYGAVPVMYGHGTERTAGVFFLNGAEQWIEVNNSASRGVEAYFMAESGAFDVFVFLGPRPADTVKQYANLTGVAPLPQLWTLGYHQCRWNYDSDEDIKYVVAEFDNYDFPIDVIWLDIEYTDEKKYFTWDLVNFSDPIGMQNNLSATDRKLVVISDPHIKVENGYFVYDEALANDYFVKTASGEVFEGDCWPGLSSYIDYLNPNASEYYSTLYYYEKFNYTTPTLAGIWNDMNEPSVFDDSIEKTFPKDNLHYGGVVHRDIHNIYGFLQTKATYRGLLARDNNEKRPFVLTRSHYSGSQRFTAVWTGDNTADWGYLDVSYSMCLSLNLGGISFCGADVGGFFNNPDEELVQRWYQSGVWLPFYRAHANMGTDRREPYLFPEDVQERIRTAIRQRYAHIPIFYTLFYEHYLTTSPVIRPLFYEYPSDANVVDIDDQLLVGQNILVRAVTEPGVSSVDVYLPGGSTSFWYDIDTPLMYTGSGWTNVAVTLDRIPVFYRGGSIIPRKDTPRKNTVDMRYDNYTVYIFADANDQASGTIYIDDYESFDYESNEFNYLSIQYSNGSVSVSSLNSGASYPDGPFNVETYLLYRPPSAAKFSEGQFEMERIEFKTTSDGRSFREISTDYTTPVKFKLF